MNPYFEAEFEWGNITDNGFKIDIYEEAIL